MRLVEMVRLGWVVCLFTISGCVSQGTGHGVSGGYEQAYSKGQYLIAYEDATKHANSLRGTNHDRAALIAGLSAHALNRNDEAEKWLRPLIATRDGALAGEAGAALGLIAMERSRYADAARLLKDASERLTGDSAARSAMYAGDSHHALGQMTDATKMYQIAAGKARTDSGLKKMIASRLSGEAPLGLKSPITATGSRESPRPRDGPYSVQVAAFTDRATAEREARKYSRWGSTRIVEISGRGQRLYAVRVVGFFTKQDADAARKGIGRTAMVVGP